MLDASASIPPPRPTMPGSHHAGAGPRRTRGAGPSALAPQRRARSRVRVCAAPYKEARPRRRHCRRLQTPRSPSRGDRVASRTAPAVSGREVARTSTAVLAIRARGCERCASPAAGRAYHRRHRATEDDAAHEVLRHVAATGGAARPCFKKLRDSAATSPTPTPSMAPSTAAPPARSPQRAALQVAGPDAERAGVPAPGDEWRCSGRRRRRAGGGVRDPQQDRAGAEVGEWTDDWSRMATPAPPYASKTQPSTRARPPTTTAARAGRFPCPAGWTLCHGCCASAG